MALINVRVQPRASRNEIAASDPDGTMRIRVTAHPAGGEANEAVVKLLARHLGVPKSALTIVRGATTRDKVIDVEGLTASDLRQKI